MKSIFFKSALAAVALMFSAQAATAAKYSYDTIPGDPMKVKMYTLPNGLRLYMSVNKDRPRIQTNIAVRVGGKNDPAETTGLAHYFEHLMFKGTPYFGTTDYAAEKPLLDKIEALFEKYRTTTDPSTRAAIYHEIDSISHEASKLAIPNEYDKLMSAIGAQGTNAYTGEDMTCYVEDIPSNQIENWARIQAVRFKEPVLRGFHTELETIYEEKNMSLTDDNGKTYEALMSLLYPHHPYGTQTILGTQEHLKNPSITNVKNYHKSWYVPNNMAIVAAGDFDPDYMVDVVTEYFGDMKPNENLPRLSFPAEEPITEPLRRDVMGPEAEMMMMGWRFPAASSLETDTLNMIQSVLSNGKTGLLDMMMNRQTMQVAGAGMMPNADYSSFVILGQPKAGQSLDEVKTLLLAEVEKLRNGDFEESIIPATINNLKLNEQRGLESNSDRVDLMVSSFINNTPWKQEVESMDRMSRMTKEQLTDFARRNLRDDNFAVVYKLQGTDTTIVKMPKPELTPIETNRDSASDFLVQIQQTAVDPIEPVFVDFARDLTLLKAKNDIPVLYKHNDTNDVFTLTYVYETGSNENRMLDTAVGYLELIGTPDMTVDDFARRFYDLACNYNITVGPNRSYITVSGLSENMEEAMKLMEKRVTEAVADEEAWELLAERYLSQREYNKSDQGSSFNALMEYSIFGPEYVARTLTNEEIENINPQTLPGEVKRLLEYPHRVIYYGPLSEKQLLADLESSHTVPAEWASLPAKKIFNPLPTPENKIFIAPYDSNQIYMYMTSNNGETYNPDIETLRRMYNDYFGGDMSSIVFQEMRESRSLAYSASAGYSRPANLDKPYTYNAFIATQNDKMMDAINAFDQIINDMPVSEKAFNLAKGSEEAALRTSRTIKDGVAWAYINAQDLGASEPFNRRLYSELPAVTLDDVVKFQQENVKGRTYTFCILGRIEDLDLDSLREIGDVVILTPEQTFGY